MPSSLFLISRMAFVLSAVISIASLSAANSKPLKIVVSIKPIHSLTAAIVEGVAEPKLLLQGASSPHTYALRPSDGEALSEADVVVRVSENLEVFLNRALQVLPKHARVIELDQAPGLMLLPIRKGDNFEGHEHGHEGEGISEHLHEDAHGAAHDDVHFWLNPREAIKLVEYLASEFSAIDPNHAAQFKSNAERLKLKLLALDEELRTQLSTLGDRPFIVFHDVTQYLETRYNLRSVGAITVSPERQPGARKLEAVRLKIERLGAVCVFSEPQFAPRLVETLIEGTRAKRGTLDEIGVGIPSGPEQYFTFMRKNAANLASCLHAETETALAPVK